MNYTKKKRSKFYDFAAVNPNVIFVSVKVNISQLKIGIKSSK